MTNAVILAEFGCVEVKPANKFEVLTKDVLLQVLSRKADALMGMANASQIGDEREGLKFQAFAIRQAIGMLKDA